MLKPIGKSVKILEGQQPHILGLRFPNYKGFNKDEEIRFENPLTLLLGRNGTNKSSLLHALYGAPHRRSTGDLWFETKVDSIPATRDGLKQSVVHRYMNKDGVEVECFKTRAPRKEDPDYWEAAKQSKKYGFPKAGVRVQGVSLEVTYLDFRAELPAFDKYFYFPDEHHLRQRDSYLKKAKRWINSRRKWSYGKQDYLRRRSQILQRELDQSGELLPDEELELISYILEREYKSATVLQHAIFHGHNGWTIRFAVSDSANYSDAFAGSGESAVTLLVHKIVNAPDNSLVLLDEPETSIHPRAQQRMVEFLADYSGRKKLQIVISTHSPYFAENLPQQSIRLLTRDEQGLISIRDDIPSNEALHEIVNRPSGKTIFVEDARAKHLVVQCLKLLPSHALKEFDVRVRNGGTSRIYRDLVAFSNMSLVDVFVIMDGDHKPERDIPEAGALPTGEAELKKLVQDLTKGNNSKGPKLDFASSDEIRDYVNFLRTNVRFLPAKTPEEYVWDDSAAEELLGKALPKQFSDESDLKQRLLMIASETPYDPDDVFKNLFAKLIKRRDSRYEELKNTLSELRNA